MTPDSITPDDIELMERLTQGDCTALAKLYDRHSQVILSLSYKLLGNRSDAEDLLHDVWLEAWQHCSEYKSDRSSVKAWLLLRTRSRALDRIRTDAYKRRRSSGLPIPEDTNIGDDLYRIPSAIANIPEWQQGVIMLAYFEGMTTSEIGHRLGIPIGTVKSRSYSAMQSLRDMLCSGV
jgi:RNA polymerase sigma-70 factor, ECF subfamily